MYTVLIVDDESIIRDGIVRMIPWTELCIGQVTTAAGSREALRVAAENPPDILITDICMDEMDGIELTRQMLQKKPSLKVIVLTGFDDFRYAQQCCRLGVKDFILKPADENNLSNSIKLQVKRLDAERSRSGLTMDRKQMLSRQREMEAALRRLTEPSAEPCETGGAPCRLPLEEEQHFQVAVLTPDIPRDSIWDKHRRLLWMSLENFILNSVDVENDGMSYQKPEQHVVIIFFVKSPCGHVREKLRKIEELVSSELDVKLNVRLGPVVDGIRGIRESYDHAAAISLSAQETGTPAALKKSSGTQRRLEALKAQVLRQSGNSDEMKAALSEFIAEIRRENLPKSTADACFYGLACDFYWKYISTTGRDPDGRLENLISTLHASDFESCCVFIEIFIAKLLTDNKQMHEIIRAAADYINEHLTEDLTVFTLAKKFHVARSYFSRLFKKETGEGCNDYITRKRIQKAKQLLLSTDLKTYEIAEQVGYHDTNYFSLAFKKNIGASPTEYKYRLSGEQAQVEKSAVPVK